MNQPLVSIIIPVHNAEKYLDETILSAINQTWPNKEIILIDDGSTDNSASILKKYENDWIKVYIEVNKGASAARNTGLEKAKGDYIQFLDADDLLDPNKIANQVKLLEVNPDKIAVCSTIHFSDGTNHLDFKPSKYEESFLIDNDPFPFLINLLGGYTNKGSMIQPNAWLTPRSVIDKAGLWNEDITLDDDGEYFCRVILSSKGVVVARNTFNYYRKNGGKSQSGHKDLKSLKSLYKSITLKHQQIQAFEHEVADKVTARSLAALLIYAYPEFKPLSNQIIADIKRIGLPVEYPVLGGPTVEFLRKLFGWKAARKMQYYSKLLKG